MTFALDARTGLPPNMRILADRYPRGDWTGHANFNGLTAFWLERHGLFRQVMDKILTDTQGQIDAPKSRYGAELARYTGFFLNELHGHHGIEDQHYFPRFAALDPRLAQAFDMLDSDHHALDGHIHALAAATNAVLGALKSGAEVQDHLGRLEQAQSAFRRFLDRHLADEEEIIVPVILEYGAGMD